MIVVNGVAKSGTHAVLALLDTFGLRRCPGTILPVHDYCYVEGMPHLSMAALKAFPDNCYILAHVPACYTLEGLKVITVFRDPRNVLVSYCRHRKRVEGLNVSITKALADFWGVPFVELYESYFGWRGKSVVLRYEDLPESVVGAGEGIYRGSRTDWNTRTGAPSRWQAVWTEEIQAAWVKTGGPELLLKAGYA